MRLLGTCTYSLAGRSDVAHQLLGWVRGEGEYRKLLADCEAFLGGRMAERLEERDGAVPIWAWTNLLAHGQQSDLADECTRAIPEGLHIHRSWRRARAYLAAEVLACVDHHAHLEIIQLQVLQPIELELGGTRRGALWQPNQWAAYVSAALMAHRDSGRVQASRNRQQRKGQTCHGTTTA